MQLPSNDGWQQHYPKWLKNWRNCLKRDMPGPSLLIFLQTQKLCKTQDCSGSLTEDHAHDECTCQSSSFSMKGNACLERCPKTRLRGTFLKQGWSAKAVNGSEMLHLKNEGSSIQHRCQLWRERNFVRWRSGTIHRVQRRPQHPAYWISSSNQEEAPRSDQIDGKTILLL